MSWEVSNLIINDDSGVTIAKGSRTLANVKPSNMYAQYLSDAQEVSLLNTNANTIICGKGNNSNGYADVFGWTLPADKTIYIQTDQNDGNVWFWWDGLSGSSSFGNNGNYFREISFGEYYTYGFKFSGSAVSCGGGVSPKTINSKTYYAQTWLGSSAQLLPIIWTTIPLSNFVINGERYDSNKSGGAGSGYIGNSLLSNKKMVGYNVPTSSAESTKTESVDEASETPVSGKPNIGNGFARIKFLRDIQVLTLEQITNGGQISGYTTISGDYTWNATPPWSEMDGRILFLKKYNGRPLEYDSNGGYFYFERKSGDSESNFYIPIPVRMKVTKITFDWMNSYRPTEWTRLGVKLEDTNQQAVDLVDFLDAQVMSDYVSYSKEFSSPVYADYILFFAWDGEYKIKNFKVYGSA